MQDISSGDLFDKLRRLSGKLPLVTDVVAMYYAMLDDETPTWAKVQIAGAIGYFVLPIDLVPDFILPIPVGYVDDAAVIAACMGIVNAHVTSEHRRRARAFFAA